MILSPPQKRLKKAAAAGVKLVFMDNKPNGLEHGKDYVSVVSADNYGNGVEAANLMAKALGEKGDIGVIFHDADFFVTKQRTEAFEKTIKEKYPNIKIVDRGGIAGPNDGEKVASAMLTKNPNLKGIFVVWDAPAEGALAAARSAGKNDLVITTIDLGTNVALNIAQGDMVKGLGAQLPYDQALPKPFWPLIPCLAKKRSICCRTCPCRIERKYSGILENRLPSRCTKNDSRRCQEVIGCSQDWIPSDCLATSKERIPWN